MFPPQHFHNIIIYDIILLFAMLGYIGKHFFNGSIKRKDVSVKSYPTIMRLCWNRNRSNSCLTNWNLVAVSEWTWCRKHNTVAPWSTCCCLNCIETSLLDYEFQNEKNCCSFDRIYERT